MPITPIRLVSKAQNGVAAFILQCKRLTFTYCDWAGSSQGMRIYIQHNLAAFAKAHPEIEIVVEKRPNKVPIVRGEYINGREKVVPVGEFKAPQQIQKKVDLLARSSGEVLRKRLRGGVRSERSEGARGIWSPFHYPV